MEEPEISRRAGCVKRLYWIGILWLIGWCTMMIEQAISWSDWKMGLFHGAYVGAFLSPLCLIITLPLGLVGYALGSWKPLRRYRGRLLWVMPALFCLWVVGATVLDRIDPGRRFERMTRVPFPAGARSLQATFKGGYFADHVETYDFRAPPEEITDLIRLLELEKSNDDRSRISGASGPAWHASEIWRQPQREKKRGARDLLLEVWTNEDRTRAYVVYVAI